MNVNRLDKWDRENLREYAEAMEHAGHHSVSVATSEVLGVLDDLDKVPALVEELRDYWRAYHDEHCGSDWPHDNCYYPPPDILDFWKGIA